MLISRYSDDNINECGCDEAGRGCLAGPVYAAAVILPFNFRCSELNDSKQLTEKQRNKLRPIIEEQALSWAVASATASEIDEINILNASILAMHRAIAALSVQPDLLLIDGNRFKPYHKINHHCIVGGDAKYLSIAAASVLAKTYRDAYMAGLHSQYPNYGWNSNMGYPTLQHRRAIIEYGPSPEHRKTFKVREQLRFDF